MKRLINKILGIIDDISILTICGCVLILCVNILCEITFNFKFVNNTNIVVLSAINLSWIIGRILYQTKN